MRPPVTMQGPYRRAALWRRVLIRLGLFIMGLGMRGRE